MYVYISLISYNLPPSYYFLLHGILPGYSNYLLHAPLVSASMLHMPIQGDLNYGIMVVYQVIWKFYTYSLHVAEVYDTPPEVQLILILKDLYCEKSWTRLVVHIVLTPGSPITIRRHHFNGGEIPWSPLVFILFYLLF